MHQWSHPTMCSVLLFFILKEIRQKKVPAELAGFVQIWLALQWQSQDLEGEKKNIQNASILPALLMLLLRNFKVFKEYCKNSVCWMLSSKGSKVMWKKKWEGGGGRQNHFVYSGTERTVTWKFSTPTITPSKSWGYYVQHKKHRALHLQVHLLCSHTL